MRVSFSPRATRQVNEIYSYIARDNAAAALRVVDRIYAITSYLADYPGVGRATDLRDVRVIPARPYPYLIFYRLVPERMEVRILRVRHAARRPLVLNDPERDFIHQDSI